MARNRDTRVGCVRAQVASSLGCPFWVPSSLSVPHSHPQGPWKSGRPSPSTLAATPARPATLQAWPTSTWSSLCKVSVPGPDSRALEAGSRWRARGFSGRKDSACLCPLFRGFRSPLFPLEAFSLVLRPPPHPGWRCPQGPLLPCSFAASPVVKPLPSVVWAVAKEEVLLPCEASGIPRPSIAWQKEGLSVPAGESPLGVLLPVLGLPTPAERSGKPVPCPEAWHSPPALLSSLTSPEPFILPERSEAGMGD